MRKKLSDLIDTTVSCMTKISNDITEKAEEQRQRKEEQEKILAEIREKLFYQSLYNLSLTDEQIYQLENNMNNFVAKIVTLSRLQSYDITRHLINQAKLNNDIELLQQVRAEASSNLDESLDFVRLLHYQLYESFIHNYYTNLTYAEVTKVKQLFFISNNSYCFIYSFVLDRQQDFEKLKENFNSFKNTLECKQLFRQFNIKKANVNFIDASYYLVIMLK